MLKAIFMDYYGTVTHENGPIAVDVVKRIYKNSDAESPEEIFRCWWKIFKEKLSEANGEKFRSQHDVALDSFREVLERFHSTEDAPELLARMEEHWCTTPVYEDAARFLEKAELPVYFVTNSDDAYVYASVEKYGLHPQGIITSEQARYSKPRKEIFLYALQKARLHPQEVIHVGDSLESDVRCPMEVGIKSIWMNREGAPVPPGVDSARDFDEVRTLLEEEM